MPRVTFITYAGDRYDVDAREGGSVMEAARDNGIAGIDADCGGMCACATCHVFVAPEWFDRLEERSEMEEDLLGLADNARTTSRLACQIRLDPALDGLTVQLPQAQH